MNCDEIGQGLCDLYDEIFVNTKRLKKKTYKDDISYYKGKYRELLSQIKLVCDSKEEQAEDAMEQIAASVPDRIYEGLSSITSKRKRGLELIDYNLAMVSYLVPLIGDIKSDGAELLADKMVAVWNQRFPETKIGKATVESINGGFRSSLCYVTTAVCKSMNKPDDCYELTLLREYRDQYLSGTEEGRAIVEAYYDIAPTIVKRIDKESASQEIYASIWTQFIHPCVTLIEANKWEQCKELYTDMIHQLETKYLYS